MNRILSIAQVGHPVLREPTAELSAEMLQSAEMQQFIDDLIATMRAANGAGLAANQVYQLFESARSRYAITHATLIVRIFPSRFW